MRARYYISFDNITFSEFWPSNEPIVTWAREPEEMFQRPKVDKFKIGRTKNEAIYDTIYGTFFDPTYFGVDIYYKINVLGTDKFYYIDPVNKGKIDTQNNIFECSPDPDDEYRDILAKYDNKYKYIGASSQLFGYSASFYVPKKDTGAFVNTNFTTFTDVAYFLSWTSDGTNIKTARNAIATATDNGDFFDIVVSNYNQSVAVGDVKIQLVNGAGTARSAKVGFANNGKVRLTQNAADTVFVQFSYEDLLAGDGSFNYIITYPEIKQSGADLYNILDTCITDVSYMGVTIDIISTILWNDALPTGSATDTPAIDTYITANPTNDYVLEAAAQWNDIWLAKTDVLTTAKEEDTETSLKDIMTILKQKLRMYWFIDPDGKFRIEHEKYFRDFAVQADLTAAGYVPDKPETDVKVYTYENNILVNQINPKEQNENTIGFVGYPVVYDPKKTSDSVRDLNINVSCDIEYITDNPNDASESGLLLLRMVPMGAKYFVELDLSTLSPSLGGYHPNAHLAWDYVIYNYWMYFAEAETGLINYGFVTTTFDHVKEFLKQDNIRFKMSTDLDWKKPFTVTEGTGWLEQTKYSPDTGWYTINIGLNPYAIDIYVVDSTDSTIGIVDDDGTTDIIL